MQTMWSKTCVHNHVKYQVQQDQLTWHSPVSGSQSRVKPLHVHGTHSPGPDESWRTR